MISFPELPNTELFEPVSTFRLVTIRADPFKSIAGNTGKLLIIEHLERLTERSDMHEQTYDILPELGMEIVNTAFTRSTDGYNRFNDDKRGAWYCALAHDTAVKEVAYNQKRNGEHTGDSGSEVILREIFADFTGTFRSAKGLPRGEGILGANRKKTYKYTQPFANKIRDEGARGIIYPSVRDPKGFCLVAFHREIVRNVRLGDRWKMSWNENGKLIMDKIEEDMSFLRNL